MCPYMLHYFISDINCFKLIVFLVFLTLFVQQSSKDYLYTAEFTSGLNWKAAIVGPFLVP